MELVNQTEKETVTKLKVHKMDDEYVLPYLNHRSTFLYKAQPVVENGIFTDQDGVKYTLQFFQGLIEKPTFEEIDFKYYTKEFAKFYNRSVRENILDFGLLAPISVIQLPSQNTNLVRYVICLYCIPSLRIIDLAKGDLSYSNMTKILNQEAKLEIGFYPDGTVPENTQDWWEKLNYLR